MPHHHQQPGRFSLETQPNGELHKTLLTLNDSSKQQSNSMDADMPTSSRGSHMEEGRLAHSINKGSDGRHVVLRAEL